MNERRYHQASEWQRFVAYFSLPPLGVAGWVLANFFGGALHGFVVAFALMAFPTCLIAAFFVALSLDDSRGVKTRALVAMVVLLIIYGGSSAVVMRPVLSSAFDSMIIP